MKLLRKGLWILPIFYMAMVWIMSSLPDNTFVELPDSKTDRMIKESLHLVEFAILYLLFVLAAFFNRRLTPAINLSFAVIAGLYGITDEIHQSFVPARSATLIDVIKDLTGVAIAYYIIKKNIRTLHRINVSGD
ncbi:VanZ family protein [Bacillus sp. CGMCC 1.16607]|uniref:VanZ family protein n=1 Tax=Bacillus sp. CGMCC 1.16607 TaxID=3351842 RepID=UPI0036388471